MTLYIARPGDFDLAGVLSDRLALRPLSGRLGASDGDGRRSGYGHEKSPCEGASRSFPVKEIPRSKHGPVIPDEGVLRSFPVMGINEPRRGMSQKPCEVAQGAASQFWS